MDYDFTTLSPTDFENLVGDLLSRIWGGRLESFKTGKDGGIDLKHSRIAAGQKPTIVQCKRYAPHKISELLRALKAEKKKLDSIKPERYVLATSVALSPLNKDAILDILAPWCKSSADIYGPSELNGLLRDFPDIQRAHFKLWIASTAVLERVIHSNIFSITEASIEATKSQLSKLVIHDGFAKALKILHENHHVLIVGNPGIGKTTLARMLMCHYMSEGFDPIWVVNDIQEAWKLISPDNEEKKIVVYDDFLGSVNFDSHRFGKNEDHALIQLLEKVNRSSNLRFILTTREYILEDAKRLHGVFKYKSDEIHKFVLSLEQYTETHRAQMLFNHLYFSDIPDEKLLKIVESEVYKLIVDHKNYNPRIIESICRSQKRKHLSDDDYVSYIKQEFNNPAMLWMHPFENEISPLARQILLVLWSHKGKCELEDIRSAISRMNSSVNPEDLSKKMKDALQQLDGNFIRTDRFPATYGPKNYLIAQFQNPSVQDLINRIAHEEIAWLLRLLDSITSLTQVETILEAATKLKRTASFPATFWANLRRIAKEVEHTETGSIINYKRHGTNTAVRCWTEGSQEHFSDKTLIRLKIEEHTDAHDEIHEELRSRVLTLKGWQELIAAAEYSNYAAYSASYLQSWITEKSTWPDEEKLKSEELLSEAVLSLLEDATKSPPSLDCLDEFYSATTSIRRELPPPEQDVFLRAIQSKVAEHLERTDDIEELRSEAEELQSLAASMKRDFGSITKKLLEKADTNDEPEDEEDHSPDFSNYSDAQSSKFNIDELFQDLLDR